MYALQCNYFCTGSIKFIKVMFVTIILLYSAAWVLIKIALSSLNKCTVLPGLF